MKYWTSQNGYDYKLINKIKYESLSFKNMIKR